MSFETEIEVDGLDVLNWIRQVDLASSKPLLVGCLLDNNIDEEALVIEDVTERFVLICRLGNEARRVPPPLLRNSSVLERAPGSTLLTAVNSVKTEGQLAIEAARVKLKTYDFPIAKLVNNDDVPVALAMMEDFVSSRLPSGPDQTARYKMLRKSDLPDLCLKVLRQWLELSFQAGGKVDAGILIRLAYCLRHSGKPEEALRVTEPAVKSHPRIALSRQQKAIMATQRAAILLDIYETRRRDPALLRQARDSANMSWAISRSDEAGLVYQRLAMLEN